MQISFPMVLPASIQATAAALADIKKGNTVAIQVDTRKWFLGTVTSKGSKKIAVDTFDGVYNIATDDVDEVVRSVDLSAMKAAEVKRAMKATYTATQLKALTPKAAPKAAVKAPKVTAPAKPPKAEPKAKVIDQEVGNSSKLAPAPKTKKVATANLYGMASFARRDGTNPMVSIYKKIFGARPPHAGDKFKVKDGDSSLMCEVNHMVSNHVMVVDTEVRRNVEFIFVKDQGVYRNDEYSAIPAQYQNLVSKPRAQTSMPTKPSPNVSAKAPAPRIVEPYSYRDKYGEKELTDAALPSDINDPAIYKQTFYGRVLSTGRSSSHLSEVVIVGTGTFKGKTAWVAFPIRDKTNRPRLLYYPIHAPKPEWLTKPQVSFEDLKRYRLRSQQKAEVVQDNREKKAQLGAQVAQSMELRVGYNALIKFTNGNFWKQILQVDHDKQVIYIQGSRTKRRTIPFALIQQTAQK
ncbi:hypothetical protein D3C85_646660 [compost metagenome]